MATYVARRLAGIIPLVLLVSLVCFALMHAVPGGPDQILGQNPKVTPADAARIRANFGLDRPWPEQYVHWLERAVVHADFGRSYVTGEPVMRMIAGRLPATLELVGSALVIALAFGLGAGILGAIRPYTATDTFLTLAALVVVSIPLFWSALMAIMLFSVRWGLLPSGGMGAISAPFSIVDHVRHLVLPSCVLSLVFIATWSRYLRATLRETLSERFIGVARAKGLTAAAVVWRHGLRSALPPVVAVIAMSLPLLFTGAVIIETVFSWPGMGRLFYEGLLRMDYSRLMGIVFVSSLLTALFNLIADIGHALLDPRIRPAG